ncbi:MAG: hypothetical protein H6618_05130 [Deltaproteobacteria bacterium]|nr:hypothetical protein [Deltaproteobacteria bacterium]
MKYTDRIKKLYVDRNISFSLNIILVVLLAYSHYNSSRIAENYMTLDMKLEKALTTARVILTPAVTAREEIERGSMVSDDYVKGLTTHVISHLESWTYENMEDSYHQIFHDFYSHLLETKSKADLISSDRFRIAREKSMVSIWKWDYSDHNGYEKKAKKIAGEFTWCGAIARACALVSGRSTIYIGHNQPYKTEEKTYFLLAKDVYPTKQNPYALKVTRLVVGNKQEMQQLMSAAKNGSIKDV